MAEISDKMKIFQERLKTRAADKHFTKESIANSLNVSLPTVKKWYGGANYPSIETLVDLSKLLKCDLDYLIGNIEQTTHDNKFICEDTGLSEGALDYIRQLPGRQKDILNKLLSSESGLSDILDKLDLAYYNACSDPENATEANTDPHVSSSLLNLKSDNASIEEKRRSADSIRYAKMVQMECKESVRTKVNEMLEDIPPVAPAAYDDYVDTGIGYAEAVRDFATNALGSPTSD
jgi:transcriptional regulator with XRE-family HTH domain